MNIPKYATFSLVARDENTGEIGIAGTTHWFGYGKNVPHIRADVGAIATQASTNLFYGTQGLETLEKTNNAQETLTAILQESPDTKGIFQVIIIDKNGTTAGHTGDNTVSYANHITEKNVAFAGNFLENEHVLIAMQQYYQTSTEPFALKLIKTLQHGQAAGGDIRGKRSATLKVIPPKTTTNQWDSILYDLRIDDASDPLKELERQYYVAKSFHFLNVAADMEQYEKKEEYFKKALETYPDNSEAYFWYAITCWENNEKEKALKLKDELVKKFGTNWEKLWERFVAPTS